VSDETSKILSSKGVARDAGDVIERWRLQPLYNSEARADRDAYYNRLAESAEDGLKHNSLCSAFHANRAIAGKGSPISQLSVNKLDGSSSSSSSESLHRWQASLNFPPTVSCETLAHAALEAAPDTYIKISLPSLQEVVKAIGRPQHGKAAGANGIHPELLKCAVGPICLGLHKILVRVVPS